MEKLINSYRGGINWLQAGFINKFIMKKQSLITKRQFFAVSKLPFTIYSYILLLFLFAASILLPAQSVFSEGSYQVGLNQSLYDYDSNDDADRIAPINRPLYVDIISVGEVINISLCGRNDNDDLEVKIYTPSGGETTYNITNSSSAGFVNCTHDFDSELTNPIRYVTTETGTYEIRLQNVTAGNTKGNDPDVAACFKRFDITVTDDALTNPDPQVARGRLYGYSWAFTAGGFDESTDADYYALVDGGRPDTNYVWFLDLNNFAGYVYDIVANEIGVESPYSGYSIKQADGSVNSLFPIYLGYPAIAKAPPNEGPVISNLRFRDSAGIDSAFNNINDEGKFLFTSDVDGTYAIIIDINGDGNFGSGDKLLLGEVNAGDNTVVWDGTTADGSLAPEENYDVQVEVRLGEYHFVATDVETSGGDELGLTVCEVNTDKTVRNDTLVFWDDKTILNGTTTLPEGKACNSNDAKHTWGDFSDGSLGDKSYIDTYVYGKRNTVTTYAVIDNNDAPLNSPEIDLDDSNSTDNDYETGFTVQGGAVGISDSDTEISDADDTNIDLATITLTNPQTNDELIVDESSTTLASLGITKNAASTSSNIILDGSASLDNYESAIELIKFNNTSNNPSSDKRTVTVVVNDGNSDSNTAICVVNIAGVIITESGGSTDVAEGGATDTYDVVLISKPTANVIVTVSPDVQTGVGNGGGVAITLTFTPSDWNSPQTVTVTAVDDSIVEGNHSSTISHTTSSTDSNFNNLTVNSVIANVTDNDSAQDTEPDVTAQCTLIIRIIPDESGHTGPEVGSHIFECGQEVNLTATALGDYEFNKWLVSGADAQMVLADPHSANTTIKLLANTTILTASFSLIGSSVDLTINVKEAGTGNTDPVPGIYPLPIGTTQNINAIPENGYVFIGWEVEGNVIIDDPNLASTSVTVYGNSRVIAKFVPESDAVTLTTKVGDEGCGTVQPEGTIHVLPGETRDIFAYPYGECIFLYWEVDDNGTVANTYNSETNVTVNGDTVVTAHFAEPACSILGGKIKIKINNKVENKDVAVFKKVPLLFTDFLPETDNILVTIDGTSYPVDISNGTFIPFGNGHGFKYKSNDKRIKLRMNFIKGFWNFKAKKTNLRSVNNLNGTDVVLKVNNTYYPLKYRMDEKVRWSFNDKVNRSVKVDLSTANSDSFEMNVGKGKYTNISSKKDKLVITKAKLSLSNEFTQFNTLITFTVDSLVTVLSASEFTQTKSGKVYNNKEAGIKMKFDFNKSRWGIKLNKATAWSKVIPADNLKVYLLVGDEYASELEVFYKSKLTYLPRKGRFFK